MSSLLQTSQNVTLPHIPELFDPNFLDRLVPPPSVKPTKDDIIPPTNPLITALLESNRTYTQNAAPALKSTNSATLDAFNQLNTWSYNEVNAALNKAWAEDPGLTLRLIWNMRSIHDGKAEKELFYRSFGWLYDNHPRTALSNLHILITPACKVNKKSDIGRPHGYWKDLLNILALATCDELSNLSNRPTFLHNYSPPQNTRRRGHGKKRTLEEINKAEEQARIRAKERRKELHKQFHQRLVRKLNTNYKYRALYITVTRLFAQQIRQDLMTLKELETVDRPADKKRYYQLLKSISLAGKWAPTPAGSHDRVTNISTAICQLLFSPNENIGASAITPLPSIAPYPMPDDHTNCVVLRSFYAHWILKPLRAIVACPEPLMSAKRWKEIRYSRVPSVCMANNKSHFFKHDPDGFQEYLIDVQVGKKKISGATLMPHELVGEAIRLKRDIRAAATGKFPKLAEIKKNMAEQEIKVVDAQWRSLVARMKESGTLDNCLAICDVSGSMGSLSHFTKRDVDPIFPSLALSLMLASLAKPPFNSGFITFSANPEFFRLENLEEASLSDIVTKAGGAPWEFNTDFQAVFLKLLLPLAKQHRVAREDMVKRLFVFSDMQFDTANSVKDTDQWETNYDLVTKAYQEAGYDVPEIVFWNLRGSSTFGETVEVEADRKGVAMMSGFSPSMMKVFMDGAEEEEGEAWNDITMEAEVVEKKEDEFTPLNVMKKALFRQSYDGLVVLD